ncbi:MAG TPA: MerR family transcriptional regulator [Candidatus Sulfomarinibacteraceae bacterium]|nr:MerR family transcriptional regulator [Candidatus Sulfomarinibacteraceae bacterium]
MKAKPRYRMISWVAEKYNVHPQTLRLWEREGLIRPTRSQGNTRLYDDEACQQLETILTLTRDLGVNLAGVEIILNLKEQIARLQKENRVLTQLVRQALRSKQEVPRYHALVKVETGSIQSVDEE